MSLQSYRLSLSFSFSLSLNRSPYIFLFRPPSSLSLPLSLFIYLFLHHFYSGLSDYGAEERHHLADCCREENKASCSNIVG